MAPPTPEQRRRPPSAKTRRRLEAAESRAAAAERRARQRRVSLAGAAVAVAVVVVVGVALAVSHGGGGPGGGSSVSTSTEPTAFDLPRLDGTGDVSLASFRGKPTVVNFFASWCTSCQFELPGFSKVSRELQGKVTFIGVNSLETGDGMAMARRYGIDWWPLARDLDGQQASGLHDALGGQGMPITAFYDASGNLLYVSPGAMPEDLLRATLRQYYGIS